MLQNHNEVCHYTEHVEFGFGHLVVTRSASDGALGLAFAGATLMAAAASAFVAVAEP